MENMVESTILGGGIAKLSAEKQLLAHEGIRLHAAVAAGNDELCYLILRKAAQEGYRNELLRVINAEGKIPLQVACTVNTDMRM